MDALSLDPHWDAANGVLANRLGITDSAELVRRATEAAAFRLLQLSTQPVRGNFDAAHLSAIHRYIFEDIFPWAGEFRTVMTARGSSFGFPPPGYIAPSLATLFTKLAQEKHLRGLDREVFIQRAAFYFGEVNAIHAFRDGNGRAQREFVRALALHAGFRLTWAGLTPQAINEASRLNFSTGDTAALAATLRERLT